MGQPMAAKQSCGQRKLVAESRPLDHTSSTDPWVSLPDPFVPIASFHPDPWPLPCGRDTPRHRAADRAALAGGRLGAHPASTHWPDGPAIFADALPAGNGYNSTMTAENDTSLLIRAIEFAARKHRRQRRKDVDASPYINHPIALMSVLCVEAGIRDTAVLSVAALHDTIEDTQTTQEEIQAAFGVEIAMLIAEMTDDKTLPKTERKRLQIAHAQHMSRDGALVKLADKICNLRDVAANPPVGWSLEEQRDYFRWAKAVVEGLPPVNAKLLQLFEQAYARMP
jgi:GTP diphosphokinase / guanosine-3',5'-bis(diphosphate) 3'-diphosphatase